MSKSYHTKTFHLSQLRRVREEMKAALPPQVRRRLAEDAEAEQELRDWRALKKSCVPLRGTQTRLF